MSAMKHFTLPVMIILVALWLPFGFSLIGLVEEWSILASFTSGDLLPLWKSQAIRPLTLLPHLIAYLLDPYSFDYWNVLLFLGLLAKGIAAGQLIWKATGSSRWGMVMAVLLLIYPADTMNYTFRCVHIHWALAFQLLASYFCVMAFEKGRFWDSTCSVVFSLIAYCMYEISLSLALLPFLILWIKQGSCHLLRERRGIVLLWFGTIFVYLIYAIGTFAFLSDTYHRKVITVTPFKTTLSHLPLLFSRGALRGLLGGWWDALQIVITEFQSYGYLVAVTLLVFFFLRKEKKSPHISSTVLFRFSVSGLLLMVLGYLPFLVHYGFFHTTQRTFLWATPGAVMAWIALLILLSSIKKWVSTTLLTLLLFFGFGAQLFQLSHYVHFSEKQRTALKQVVKNFDGNLNQQKLIILDHTNQMGVSWTLPQETFIAALSYFYGRPIQNMEICRVPSGEIPTLTWEKKASCTEQPHSWKFSYIDLLSDHGKVMETETQEVEISKDQVITVNIFEKGSFEPLGDDLHGDVPLALRYRGILKKQSWPFHCTFFKSAPKHSYHWNGGHWWGLDRLFSGTGWHEGVGWTINHFTHESWIKQKKKTAVLYFELLPLACDYKIRGKLRRPQEDVRQHLHILMNEIPLHYRWISKQEFEAEIAPEILRSGKNEITFHYSDAPYSSLRLIRFEIDPS